MTIVLVFFEMQCLYLMRNVKVKSEFAEFTARRTGSCQRCDMAIYLGKKA